jgi:DNA-binding transcriptional LysR family regulator
MRLDTLGLAAFVAVAEHGSFQKAANSLFITPAGLSRRLKNLEDQLDIVLIERTTRTWRLSRVGISFLPRAQRLLSEMQNAFHEIRDASRAEGTEISVACMSSVAHHLLPQIILKYAETHPGSRVRIVDGTSSEVTDAVLTKRCEIGIVVPGGPFRGIQATPLMRDPFMLVCRDDNPLCQKKEIRWKDLNNEALILLSHAHNSGLSFQRAVSELKLVLPRLYEVQHSTTALGLVNAGLGAAILPSLNLFRDVYPRIRALPLTEPVIERIIGLIHLQDTALSPAAESFCDAIRSVISTDIRPALDLPAGSAPEGTPKIKSARRPARSK